MDRLLPTANKNRSRNCNSLPLATWKSKTKCKLNLLPFCPQSLPRNIYCHTLRIIGWVGPSCRRFLSFSSCTAELNAPSIHPSIPHRAPAQVLSAGPTNPRQPWVTAHAGDTGHPHHITGADAVSSWNSCPGRCYCISHSESFKAKSPSLGRTKCHVCSAEQ